MAIQALKAKFITDKVLKSKRQELIPGNQTTFRSENPLDRYDPSTGKLSPEEEAERQKRREEEAKRKKINDLYNRSARANFLRLSGIPKFGSSFASLAGSMDVRRYGKAR